MTEEKEVAKKKKEVAAKEKEVAPKEKEPEPVMQDAANAEPSEKLPSEVRNWAMACHLSAFLAFVVPFVGSVIGPLIVWTVKKEESEFIAYHGKEALNFQLTVIIALLVSGLLSLILIGFLLMAIVGITAIILTLIASIKASEGEYYKYPFSLKLIS